MTLPYLVVYTKDKEKRYFHIPILFAYKTAADAVPFSIQLLPKKAGTGNFLPVSAFLSCHLSFFPVPCRLRKTKALYLVLILFRRNFDNRYFFA
ncbi:MAG: hypothetical protein E6593_02110 [Clostridium sp.]|nr:hypothetical protein [Clostridium sp.]